MLRLIRSLFCRHDYTLQRVVTGDEIIGRGYRRYEVQCQKCGSTAFHRVKPEGKKC